MMNTPCAYDVAPSVMSSVQPRTAQSSSTMAPYWAPGQRWRRLGRMVPRFESPRACRHDAAHEE